MSNDYEKNAYCFNDQLSNEMESCWEKSMGQQQASSSIGWVDGTVFLLFFSWKKKQTYFSPSLSRAPSRGDVIRRAPTDLYLIYPFSVACLLCFSTENMIDTLKKRTK